MNVFHKLLLILSVCLSKISNFFIAKMFEIVYNDKKQNSLLLYSDFLNKFQTEYKEKYKDKVDVHHIVWFYELFFLETLSNFQNIRFIDDDRKYGIFSWAPLHPWLILARGGDDANGLSFFHKFNIKELFKIFKIDKKNYFINSYKIFINNNTRMPHFVCIVGEITDDYIYVWISTNMALKHEKYKTNGTNVRKNIKDAVEYSIKRIFNANKYNYKKV